MKISFHNEEEYIGPEGVGSEKNGYSVAKEDVEHNSANDEEDKWEEKVGCEEAESTYQDCLSVSLPLYEFIGGMTFIGIPGLHKIIFVLSDFR